MKALPLYLLTAITLVSCTNTITPLATEKKEVKSNSFWVVQTGHGNKAKIVLKRHDGSEQVLDGRGLVSHHPTVDSSGQYVAYAKEVWKTSRKLNIHNIATGERAEYSGKLSNKRSGNGSWSEDGRAIYLNNGGLLARFDIEKKTFGYQLKYKSPEQISTSPDGKRLVFKERNRQGGVNDIDYWQLHMFDTGNKQSRTLGNTKDNKGAFGRFYWSPDSQRVLVNLHYINSENKVLKSETRWFSLDFEPLEKPVDSDLIYHPQHYPHVISIKHGRKDGILHIH